MNELSGQSQQPQRRTPAGILTLAAIAVLGMLGFLAYRRHGGSGANVAPKRVAILPFQNQGSSGEQYFADGLTDEVRAKLTAIPGLEIVSGESSLPYRKTAKTPQRISSELGVRYLLTAVVRREKGAGGEDAVHLTPQLLEVGRDSAPAIRWQKQFDEPLANLFQIEADIAAQVAFALNVPVDATVQARLAERPTRSLAAYDLYLRGTAAYDSAFGAFIAQKLDPASMGRIAGLFQQTVTLDSTFATAWSALAAANLVTFFTRPDSALLRRTRQAADRAVSLAPGKARTHVVAAAVLGAQGETERARQEAARALALAPNDVDVLDLAANRLWTDGRFEEGAPFGKRAASLNPRAEYAFEDLSFALLYARRPDDAFEAAEHARLLEPVSLVALDQEIFAHLARGDLTAARAVLTRATGFDQTALLAYVAYANDLYWVLDEAQQQAVIGMAQSAFRDRGAWANTRAQLFALRKDTVRMRAYADTAQAALGKELRDLPRDQDRRVIRALMLAYLGRKAEAEQQATIAVEGSPPSANAYAAPYIRHQQIRIHLVLGETEQALSELEQLFKTPYYMTNAWLRIDPTFAPLKGNPRFERLARE